MLNRKLKWLGSAGTSALALAICCSLANAGQINAIQCEQATASPFGRLRIALEQSGQKVQGAIQTGFTMMNRPYALSNIRISANSKTGLTAFEFDSGTVAFDVTSGVPVRYRVKGQMQYDAKANKLVSISFHETNKQCQYLIPPFTSDGSYDLPDCAFRGNHLDQTASYQEISCEVQDSSKVTTSTGARFERIAHPAFGALWKDQEQGLLWSEPKYIESLEEQDRSLPSMVSHDDLEKYCAKNGGRLPTAEELRVLSSEMGRGSKNGYYAQAFLRSYPSQVNTLTSDTAWTSPENPYKQGYFFMLDMNGGEVFGTDSLPYYFSCVINAQAK